MKKRAQCSPLFASPFAIMIRIWTIPNLCLYLHRLIDYTKTCYLVAGPKTSTFEHPFSARQHHRLRHTAWALCVVCSKRKAVEGRGFWRRQEAKSTSFYIPFSVERAKIDHYGALACDR